MPGGVGHEHYLNEGQHNLVSVLINGRQVSGPFNIRAFFAIVSSDIYVYSIVKVIDETQEMYRVT